VLVHRIAFGTNALRNAIGSAGRRAYASFSVHSSRQFVGTWRNPLRMSQLLMPDLNDDLHF
jgi:hypothetical protein